jgi:PAS domain S-box-containing protein
MTMDRRVATAEQAGEASERFTLEEMPVPMVYATYRIIRDCNAAFAALFGFARHELTDESFSRLYPSIDAFVRTGQMWTAHLLGGQRYYDERIMKNAAGVNFWCRVNGVSRTPSDPFAEAIYCFEPMTRPVVDTTMPLSDRQRQVLTLVAQGKTNAQIAGEIGLSRRTVEAHRARLMKSIGVRNAAELAGWFAASRPQ